MIYRRFLLPSFVIVRYGCFDERIGGHRPWSRLDLALEPSAAPIAWSVVVCTNLIRFGCDGTGYPPEGYPKDAYPPAGYPAQPGYPPAGYPPQPGYPPPYASQYGQPPPQQQQQQSSGFLEGWCVSISLCSISSSYMSEYGILLEKSTNEWFIDLELERFWGQDRRVKALKIHA